MALDDDSTYLHHCSCKSLHANLLGDVQSSADVEQFLIGLERPSTVSIKRSRRRQIFVVPPRDDDPYLTSEPNVNAKGRHEPTTFTSAAIIKQPHGGSSQSLGGQKQRYVGDSRVTRDHTPPTEQMPRVTQTYSKKKKFTKHCPPYQPRHRTSRRQEDVYSRELPPIENVAVEYEEGHNILPENANVPDDLPETPFQKPVAIHECPPKQKKTRLEPAKAFGVQTQKKSTTSSRKRQVQDTKIDGESSIKRKHGVKSPQKSTQHKRLRGAPINELALVGVVPEPETSKLEQETETDSSDIRNVAALQPDDIKPSHHEKDTRATKTLTDVLQRKKFIISVDGFKYKYPSYTTPKHHGNVHWQPGSGFDEQVLGKLSKKSTKARSMSLLKTGRAQHIRTGILDLTAHVDVPREGAVIPSRSRERATSAETGMPKHGSNRTADISIKQALDGENAARISTATNEHGQTIATQLNQPADHDSIKEPGITRQKERLLDEECEDISNSCGDIAKAAGLASSAPPRYLHVSQKLLLTKSPRLSSEQKQSVSACQPFPGDNSAGSQRGLVANMPIERPTEAPSHTNREVQPERKWQISMPMSSQRRMEVMEDIDNNIDLAQPSSYYSSQRRQSYWPFGRDGDLLGDHEGMTLVCRAKWIPAEVLETQERHEAMGSVEIGAEYPIDTSNLDAATHFSQAMSQLGMHNPKRTRAVTKTSHASTGGHCFIPPIGREVSEPQRLTQPESKHQRNSNRPSSTRIRTQAGQAIPRTEGRTLANLTRQASIELGTIPSSRRKSTILPFVPPLKVRGGQRTLSS